MEREHVETHVSTVEPGAQAAARVPRAHGDESRSQDPERAPRTGPQEPERLNAPGGAAPRLTILTKRADFLRAARAERLPCPGFLLQARQRGAEEPATGIRIGYTCSKKVGNAVTRNRAKRRLRAIARDVLPAQGRDGWDYVLVGRPGATVDLPFAELSSSLARALRKLHR